MCMHLNTAARPGAIPVAHRILLPLAGPRAIPLSRPLPVSIRPTPRDRSRAVTTFLVLPGLRLQFRESMDTCDAEPWRDGQLHPA